MLLYWRTPYRPRETGYSITPAPARRPPVQTVQTEEVLRDMVLAVAVSSSARLVLS